ncbi:hypothetical protein [Actinacidiphila sp. ITFR-21]|uniref:hypothetical protein n=1 Tax=Actinacidiphila sp. ITFR-21 TaxID=3075199 RepID=UPI002889430D|nr:hypothetical protein [Streptomyces sp. ITFR-21]WNI15979.1 hypothetical protein RLT57_10900 [Streptomyces sp. ITFR-21]
MTFSLPETPAAPRTGTGDSAPPVSPAAQAAPAPAAPIPTGPTESGGADGQTTALPRHNIPPLEFVVPESFHALPIAATSEERAVLAAEFVRELYSNADHELWGAAAPQYAALGEAMGGQGLDYSAMGLFTIDEGVAHCSFTVAAIASDHPSVEVAASGIREILVRDENNDARWIDLPCGPAVSCVTLREYVIGADLTASGTRGRLLMGQVQVYVPFPTGPYTAVFTLDTAAVDYWGEFSEMTVAVLRSIRFPPDETPDGAPAGTGTGGAARPAAELAAS